MCERWRTLGAAKTYRLHLAREGTASLSEIVIIRAVIQGGRAVHRSLAEVGAEPCVPLLELSSQTLDLAVQLHVLLFEFAEA